jgi:diadenosine tetraphosphate (Ap4A) HIT family hydrolase
MNDCEFCSIVAGESPGSFVYEDEISLAMLTLRPMNRGHTLVIPKTHASSLSDLDEAIGGHLFQIGMRAAKYLRNSPVRCDDINFWLADGPAAGQEVFHVHLHVLPRFEQDSIRLEADRIDPSREEMDSTAKEIRSVVSEPKN